MKISVNVEAEAINVLPLNLGKIAVDVKLAELVDAVNSNGCLLRIAEEPGKLIVEAPPLPLMPLNGIQCSTAHITHDDNQLLYQLSHRVEEYGDSEWIHFSGTGYLLRLSAWQYPVLRLKRLGLSKACRRLVVTLIRRYSVCIIHLDACGELLPGFEAFDW
ncbi:DUF5983 family protein [Yersinia enterocolitica]|nr:hypothetical protein [Yersinia enterocolitica]EKN5104337.1 hypothetical protein [Yersinia enterocolitica]